MLRKQNNLLSHWLNNQCATVLVTVCSSPLTCCPWSYRGTRGHIFMRVYSQRLSTFMAALAGVASLACAHCQPPRSLNASQDQLSHNGHFTVNNPHLSQRVN